MTYQEEYNQLDARQVKLISDIQESDAHALKCVKLGTSFQETYPDDYTTYVAAREEYNQNEVRMEELAELIKAEEESQQEDNIEHD